MDKSNYDKQYQRFVCEYLEKLPEDHEQISKPEDFKKMCKKWGVGYINHLKASFTAWKEMPKDIMSEYEFKQYNGISDEYFNTLKNIA